MAAERPPPAVLGEAGAVFRDLNAKNADYVVIGGFAVNMWGVVAGTEDIDIAILPRNREDFLRVAAALRARGYAPTALKTRDGRFLVGKNFGGWTGFMRAAEPFGDLLFVQFFHPRRFWVNANLSLTGVSVEQVRGNSLRGKYNGVPVRVISLEDLVRNKRAIASDPSATEDSRVRAKAHLSLIEMALHASRRRPFPEGATQRRYRKIGGRTRIVEVRKKRGGGTRVVGFVL